MATPELATPQAHAGRRGWLPAGISPAWLGAYATIWAETLAVAAVVLVSGRALADPTKGNLRLALSPRLNAPPDLARILALAAHNIPIAAWPLLLGAIGAHRHRLTRRLADALVLACLIANTLPVAAALGAYQTALLPYIPQLPVEWAALALGAAGWITQREHPMRPREGLACLLGIVLLLLYAAALETSGVPHR
jgi:hypothetical protein